jgi:FkbM family methyltransferase
MDSVKPKSRLTATAQGDLLALDPEAGLPLGWRQGERPVPIPVDSPPTPGAWPFPEAVWLGPYRLRPTRYGLMCYNPRDIYVGRALDLYGEFSAAEARLLQALVAPGAVAVDAGAHVGAHTLALADAVAPGGAVLAFEPQRLLFQMLCANLALNGISHVHAEQAALGAEAGYAVVPLLDPAVACNFAGLSLEGRTQGERIRRMPLDDYRLDRCDLIKIDVEGMESQVLAGARATIGRLRPLLYVENDRRERSAALIQQLIDLGYRLYWHLPPLFAPDNFAGNPVNVFADIVSVNLLGLPKESQASPPALRPVWGPEDWWQDPV